MSSSTILGERTHLRAAQVVLRMQVEEVKKVQVDLGAVVRLIRLGAKFYITFFIAIDYVGSCTKCWEDLTQLVVLVGLVETGCDLVHARHWASGGHVDPEGREKAKDATLEVFWILHDVLLVSGIARVQSIGKSPIIIVPLHHQRTSWIVLGMLLGRPHFARPAVGVEVTLGGTVERREFGGLAAVMVLDVMESLLEVLVTLAWIICVGLKDDMRKQGGQLPPADIVGSETKRRIVFVAELRVKPSCHDEGVVGVEPVSHREEEVPVVLTEYIHDSSNVLFVFILNPRSALEHCRVDPALGLGVQTVGDAVFDADLLIFVEPVLVGPNAAVSSLNSSSHESNRASKP